MRMAGGQDSLRCDYCKNIYFSTPDDSGVRYLDQLPKLPCPVCAVALWNATLAGIGIRACKRCRGTLVPMAIFEDLVEKLREQSSGTDNAAPDAHALDQRLNCPQCHEHMDTHFYYGGGRVVMADCERCSLNWLDGGALMRIVHAPQPDGAQAGA